VINDVKYRDVAINDVKYRDVVIYDGGFSIHTRSFMSVLNDIFKTVVLIASKYYYCCQLDKADKFYLFYFFILLFK
jgi:hypothetical protein